MDNLTYSLLGVVLALGRPGRGLTRKIAIVTAILAANLPDIDIVLWLVGGPTAFIFRHATVTHSLLALGLLPLVLAGLVAIFTKAPFRLLWLLSAGAYLGHLGLDAAAAWGITPLAPFSDVRVGAGWVYMSDLVVWSLLALPLWVPRFAGVAADRVATVALGLCVGYVGLLGGLHAIAKGHVTAVAEAMNAREPEIEVFASPFMPFAWNGIIRDGHTATQVRARLFGESTIESRQLINFEHPAVRAALATEVGQAYLRWAASPVAEVLCLANFRHPAKDAPMQNGHLAVRFRDLRFVDPWVELPAASLVFDVADRGPIRDMVVEGHRWVTPWGGGGDTLEAKCEDAPIAPRPKPPVEEAPADKAPEDAAPETKAPVQVPGEVAPAGK
jgi:membrane-bound metal-dependent hydrolase YbcI (DUF457 family)